MRRGTLKRCLYLQCMYVNRPTSIYLLYMKFLQKKVLKQTGVIICPTIKSNFKLLVYFKLYYRNKRATIDCLLAVNRKEA